MRTVPDTKLQATLLREIDVSEKKLKVEEHLRTADMRSKLLIDSAARKDIEELDGWGDAGSADIMTEVSRGTDKYLWLLEAHTQAH